MLVEKHQHRLGIGASGAPPTSPPCWYFLLTHLLRSQDPGPSYPWKCIRYWWNNTNIGLGSVLQRHLRPPRPCWYFLPTHLLRSQDPGPSLPREMHKMLVEKHQHRLGIEIDIRGNTNIGLGLKLTSVATPTSA